MTPCVYCDFFFDSSPMIAHSFQTRLINIVKPSQDVISSLWQFIFYVPSFFNTSAADWKKIGKLTRKIWQVFIFCSSIVNLDLICVRLCEKIQNRKWNFFVLSQIHTFVFVFPTNKKIPFNQNLVKVHYYYSVQCKKPQLGHEKTQILDCILACLTQ